MKLKDALKKIAKSNGKIFTVEFTKKDGTLRKMTCRLGVNKYVTGVGMSYDPFEKGLIPVYDMALASKSEEEDLSKCYRMINTKTLISLNGEEVTQ